MPGWINTPEEEAAWKKAKGVVSKQRKKKESEFKDQDWGLVTKIAKNILEASSETLIYHLSDVQYKLEARTRQQRKAQDIYSPNNKLLASLSTMAALNTEVITALRACDEKVGQETLAKEIQETTTKLRLLLAQVKK